MALLTEGYRISAAFLELPEHADAILRVVYKMVQQKMSSEMPSVIRLNKDGVTVRIVCDTSGSCCMIETIFFANKVGCTFSGKDNLILKVDLRMPLGTVKRFADVRLVEKIMSSSKYYSKDEVDVSNSGTSVHLTLKKYQPLTANVVNPWRGFNIEIFRNQVRAVADKLGLKSAASMDTRKFALVLSVTGSVEQLLKLPESYKRLGFIFRFPDHSSSRPIVSTVLHFHRKHPNKKALGEFLGNWQPPDKRWKKTGTTTPPLEI